MSKILKKEDLLASPAKTPESFVFLDKLPPKQQLEFVKWHQSKQPFLQCDIHLYRGKKVVEYNDYLSFWRDHYQHKCLATLKGNTNETV